MKYKKSMSKAGEKIFKKNKIVFCIDFIVC